MASEWEVVELQDVADELTVGFVGPMATEYLPKGVPFLRSLNIDPLRIKTADMKFVSEEFHARLSKSALGPGDVVIVRTGKPGACAVIPSWLPIANCSDVVIVRTGKRINPHFLAYYVNAVAHDHVAAHLVGAVQQHFNVGAARKIKIPLPSISTQSSIVSALRALDERIDLLQESSSSLESIAQSTFKSWFVDFDPVRAKAEGREPEGMDAATAALFPGRFETSATGTVPKGWRIAPFAEVADVIYGAPFASKSFNAERIGIPLVRIRDLKTMQPTVFTDEVHPKGYLLSPGDVVVGMDGEFRAYHWLGNPSWLNQRVCTFLPKVPSGRVFVREALRPLLEAVERGQVGTTVIHIGKADIDRFMTIVPSASVLSAFNDIAESALTRIALNAATARSLTDLRDTLLPRLISGKLRIPEAEKLIEAVL